MWGLLSTDSLYFAPSAVLAFLVMYVGCQRIMSYLIPNYFGSEKWAKRLDYLAYAMVVSFVIEFVIFTIVKVVA